MATYDFSLELLVMFMPLTGFTDAFLRLRSDALEEAEDEDEDDDVEEDAEDHAEDDEESSELEEFSESEESELDSEDESDDVDEDPEVETNTGTFGFTPMGVFGKASCCFFFPLPSFSLLEGSVTSSHHKGR